MNNIQKWCIVIAVFLIGIGTILNAFHGRYKMAVITETSQAARAFTSARFDTWTGEIEVKAGQLNWQKGSSFYIEELK